MTDGTTVLRIFAVLIALRALTNVLKPWGAGSGLVFFGTLLGGTANLILAPLVGLYMLAYAYGIWTQRRFALPMGIAYAVFVTINLIMFPILQPLPEGVTPGRYAVFVVVAFTIPVATVWLLARRLRSRETQTSG
jgi:hypothetical protein